MNFGTGGIFTVPNGKHFLFLITSIERVPRVTLKSPVGEVELCVTYIDPILSPLFTDPDRDIFLRW